MAIGEQAVGFVDGNRLAALKGREVVESPSAHEPIHDAVHPAAESLATPDGQLVYEGDHQALRRVVGAYGFFGAQVGQVLWRTDKPQASNPGVPPGVRVCQEF